MKHSPKHVMEYAGLRVVVFVLRLLPYRASLALAWCMAWPAFHASGFRARRTRSRIREVFGSRFTSREAARIAWLAWRNFVFGAIDLVRAPMEGSGAIHARMDDGRSLEKIRAHLRETGLGTIIAIPHMGAWEMAAFAARGYGIPLFTVAARQKNRLADDFMNRVRRAAGVEIVMRDSSALKIIIGRIREGKVLAVLPDVRAPSEALRIRFLGKTANIAGGMGFIAAHTGVPVFPAIITRVGWTRHRLKVFDPIPPDPEADKRPDASRITQSVFDVFDRCIREEPEQWFWFNKRWVLDPLVE